MNEATKFFKTLKEMTSTPTMGMGEYITKLCDYSANIRIANIMNDMDSVEHIAFDAQCAFGYWMPTQAEFDQYMTKETWESRTANPTRKQFLNEIYSNICSLEYLASLPDSECRLICLNLQDRAKDIFTFFTDFLESYVNEIKAITEVSKDAYKPKGEKENSSWSIKEEQKTAIQKIIDDGKKTKRTKIDSLRLIFSYFTDNKINIPDFNSFDSIFNFSNRSDYNNEVKKLNDKPFIIDKEFHF